MLIVPINSITRNRDNETFELSPVTEAMSEATRRKGENKDSYVL